MKSSLKNEDVQKRYWEMIQEKLNVHWKDFPMTSSASQLRSERESNILLHLRKLREGILASQRKDEFALSVYETSFYSALIFHSSLHASTSLSHLPELYSSLLFKPHPKLSVDQVRSRAETLATISLIFHLDESFPSQGTYYRHVRSLEPLHLDWNSNMLKWISSLRASAVWKNYARCELLTRHSRVVGLLENLSGVSEKEKHLIETSLRAVIDALRQKLRNSAWVILRFSYRELTINADTDTAAWLSRSLMLDSIGGIKGIGVEEWMKQKHSEQQVIAKDEERWTLRR
ncbi:hypothetical protein EW145_g4333 [Phellinidium pouzarii]|uniref:PCI domain-containing protein n=1 Tax=Phellinidium pouzarii TaxID=167371 RepID=A0A4S4L910_9AGAM|nr:hypothetical protein EW145_g4333 [Phellinidium pouzarii]